MLRTWIDWLRDNRFIGSLRPRRTTSEARRGRLGVEALEDRILPAVSLVNAFTGLAFHDMQGYRPLDTSLAAGTVSNVDTVNLSAHQAGSSNQDLFDSNVQATAATGSGLYYFL
jgi:hypothetical protein